MLNRMGAELVNMPFGVVSEAICCIPSAFLRILHIITKFVKTNLFL